jgi:hypothetical protein
MSILSANLYPELKPTYHYFLSTSSSLVVFLASLHYQGFPAQMPVSTGYRYPLLPFVAFSINSAISFGCDTV